MATIYYIPYIIEDDGALKTMHISRADIIDYSFGRKHIKVFLVPTTDEKVFHDVLHYIWADLSKQARETRCKIPDGIGGFITCKGKCRDCNRTRKGLPDSLDAEMEFNGYEVEDPSIDKIEIATLKITLQELFKELRKKNSNYADILEGLYGEMSHQEIALNLGKSESTIQEQAALALIVARSILSDR